MTKRGNNMIKVDNLSYSFPQKDLYNNISFTIEEGQHCAALVRASAARREEESGAGLVWRNFAEGFPVLRSKPCLSAVCRPVFL